MAPISQWAQCPTSVSISASTGNSICEGTFVTFTANATGGTGTLSYQWQINDSDVGSSSTGNTYNTSSLNNGDKVKVIITSSDGGGCTTASNVLTITVNPIRTGSATIQANNSNICPGENVSFSISNISNAGNGASYIWKVNGAQVGTNPTSYSSNTLSDGDKITLTVQSTVPCTADFTSNEIIISEKPGPPATPGTISGTADVCPGTSQTYSISAVANATSYNWTVPSGWTINSGQNSTSITVTAGNANQSGNISVSASDDCGTSSDKTLAASVKPGTPAIPGTISGTADVCPGTSQTYSISAVANATSYNWSVPSGWTINSGQNSTSITVTAGNAGQNGNISVNASDDCGTSSDKTLAASVKPGTPATPGTISGTADVCPGTSQTYSISAVANATSYNWSVPSGWTINSGQNSTSITLTAGNASQNGNISVNASDDCGTSADKTLAVTVKAGTPATPGTISGTADVCPGTSQTYSISAVANATSYNWSVPSGWTINSGQNTTSITVTAGNAGQNGNISVNAADDCGTSADKTFAVTVKAGTPNAPGTITGPTEVCSTATGLTYSISTVPNATSYNWNLPTGWTITSSDKNAPSITVKAASASGNITVTAQNDCGVSSAQTLAVNTTNGVPAQPGLITSSLPDNNKNICPSNTDVIFTTSGTGPFEWTVPSVGWDIVSGAGTNSIKVRVTPAALNGTQQVSVLQTNICGSSASTVYSGIEVNSHIVADIGKDQTACHDQASIQISGTRSFGNANLTTNFSTSGNGTFSSIPNNNKNGSFTITYTFGTTDVAKGQITLTMTIPEPNGNSNNGNQCGSSSDSMTLFFRDTPTASISAGPTICAGTSTDLTITGTPNTTVTYKKGNGANQTVNLGSGGSATINTGNLTSSTSFQLVSSIYNNAPTCQADLTASSTITVTPIPTATISYPGTPFCTSDSSAKSVELSGTGAFENGSFSASPSGLTIDSTSGSITPSTSTAGTYTVKYTVPASGGCGTVDVTTQVIITKIPTSSISYAGTPFCQSVSSPQAVTLTGTDAYTGGAFTSTSGLTIDANTGAITPSSSTPGTYTVTYTTPAGNGCGTTTSTTEIVITETPTPSIEYATSEFCTSETSAQDVNLTGAGNISNGTYSAPSGLTIDSTTGAITASSSTPGTYTVTYTLAPNEGCGEITSTTEITITQEPSVDVSYNSPFCTADSNLKAVVYTNGIGAYENGTFSSSPSGLSLTSDGKIDPSASTAGTYTVTYELPASGGCGTKDVTTTVDISEAPQATISYGDSPFCNSDSTPKAVSFSQTAGAYENGSFSSSAGLTINENTGEITPSTSTPGNYTVTYTIPAGVGCNEIAVTTDVQVHDAPQITTQPYNVAVCTANSATLEVAASGDNLTYQWYKGAGTGTPISGATSPTLTINNATIADDGTYYVMVSGEAPCSSVKSDEVTLNVDENIVVNTQPVSQDLCEDGTLNLNIDATATGGSPQYQWRINGNPLSDGGNITGATSANLSITNLSASDAGDYDVVIDGPDGYTCDVGYSNLATITVSPPPTADAGADFQVCSTNTAISLKGSDASVSNYTSLEWTTTNGAGTITNPSSLDATYQPDASDYNKNIEFTLTSTFEINGTEPCSAAVSTKDITILPLPEITSFSYSGTEFCETDTQTQSPTVTGNYFTPGDGSYSINPGTGLILDTTTGVITPNGSTPGDYTITYTAPSNEFCIDAVTATFDISIGEKPVADFSYASSPYCSNASNPSPTLETGAVAGTFSSTSGLVFVDASTGEIDIAASTPGTYTVTNTIASNGGCAEVSETSDITITKLPLADFSYEYSPYCSNAGNPTITLASGAETGTFTSTSGLVFANASTGEIDIASSTPGAYTVTNTIAAANGCDDVTATAEITITQLPDATFSYDKPAYCISEGSAIVTTGYQTGGIFSSTDLGSHLNAATGKITWAATDVITGSHTVTYTFAAAGGCEAVSTSIPIQIDPKPVGGTLSFGSFGRIYMVCEDPSGDWAVPLKLTGQQGQIVAWKYRGSSAISWTTITQNGNNYTEDTLPIDIIQGLPISETTIFQVEVASGACTPNILSQNAILSVIPSDIKPSPVTANPKILCIGDPVTLNSSTGYASGADIGGGEFNTANSIVKVYGWRVRKDGSTTDLDFPAGGDNTKPNIWSNTNDHPFSTASLSSPYSTTDKVWDSGDKKFAIVSGANPSTLETPVFNTYAMQTGILTFDQAYNLTPGASIRVEISTDGGQNYQSTPLYEITTGTSDPGLQSGNFNSFGTGTPSSRPKNKIVLDISDYLGQGNLRIRFHYIGKRTGDIWALDNIQLPNGPNNVSLQWTDYTNPDDPKVIGTNNTEQWTPSKIGWNIFEVQTLLVFSSTGQACPSKTNSESIKVFAFDSYISTATAKIGSCGDLSAHLNAEVVGGAQGNITTFPTADGYTAKWTVVNAPTGFVASDSYFSTTSTTLAAINDPQAVFTPNIQGAYTLRYGLTPTTKDDSGNLIENTGCPPTYIDVPFDIKDCTTLDFDGVDDYVDLGDTYTGNYSIEAWVRPEANSGTIISGPGYEIKMADLPGSIAINSRWYHVAVSGGKLYVDGIDMGAAGSGTGGDRTLIGARWNNTTEAPENYFSGWIEEVRIWNKVLTQDQIQFMMNQHLQNAGNMGVEIPMAVPGGLAYSDLAGYYRLISANPDPLNLLPFDAGLMPAQGKTPDLATTAVAGVLHNMTTDQQNTAPLPYISAADGKWTTINTWLRPAVWDIPDASGLNGNEIAWNIVRTLHNVTSDAKDITVLGLKSEAGELTMANPSGAQDETNTGQFLRVTHYLKLDGSIDLLGESQLLQDEGSVLDEASSGFLERDQQGKMNSFVYNYWSSPVSAQGAANNSTYSIKEVLRDGMDSQNPGPINFRYPYASADGAITSPITLSTYWMWAFHGTANDYFSWTQVLETGHINTGEGYTMKGTAGNVGLSATQNYVFTGKPHNGDIDRSFEPGKNYLIGNPYPSAIDANEFIRDNLKDVAGGRNDRNMFNGTLYFWDHFQIVDHILKTYIGGYATYNLLGAVHAITNDDRVDETAGDGSKLPGQYIPVAQGFMINSAPVAGMTFSSGNVHFKNSQRIYERENSSASVFLKPEVIVKSPSKYPAEDNREKIRLSYKSPLGYHRQILVGADPHTTNGYDLGYDAPLFENNIEDMYWLVDNEKMVIQGVPNFNEDQVLPLGVKLKDAGELTIKIDSVENIDDSKNIYLHDKLKDSIHDLRASSYVTTADAGDINDRFEVVFYKEVTSPTEPPEVDPGEGGELPVPIGLDLKHSYTGNELQILNPDLVDIPNLIIFDLNGKLLKSYRQIPKQKEVRLQVPNYSSGIYIVKMYLRDRIISKKIIIRN